MELDDIDKKAKDTNKPKSAGTKTATRVEIEGSDSEPEVHAGDNFESDLGDSSSLSSGEDL